MRSTLRVLRMAIIRFMTMRSTVGLILLTVATVLIVESCICSSVRVSAIIILNAVGAMLVYSMWAPRFQRVWGKIVEFDNKVRRK